MTIIQLHEFKQDKSNFKYKFRFKQHCSLYHIVHHNIMSTNMEHINASTHVGMESPERVEACEWSRQGGRRQQQSTCNAQCGWYRQTHKE